MKTTVKSVLKFFECIFLPNRCIFCGKLISPSEEKCSDCVENLPYIKGEICLKCGQLKSECSCEYERTKFYDGIAAPFYYDGAVKDGIHRFKFNREKFLGKFYARYLAEYFAERYSGEEFDYIACVPVDRKKRGYRGFNQSEVLAKELSKLVSVPFARDMLLKIYPNREQVGLTGRRRVGNVLGVFDVNDKYELSGKRILLIDDVKTTGSTLSECGKMLFLYGADKVFCLTVAVVNSKIDK